MGAVDAAAGQPKDIRLAEFNNAKAGFSISYPADWFPVAHPAMAFQARPSLDSLFVLRVQVNKAAKGATAESYAKAEIKRFGQFWTVDGEEPATWAASRRGALRICR